MITVEQVYGTPERPDELPVFKDYLPGVLVLIAVDFLLRSGHHPSGM